jgi:hypothetical protein
MAINSFYFVDKLQGSTASDGELRPLRHSAILYRTLVPILVTVAITSMVGCSGSKESSVTGHVTLDGSPLSQGTVAFEPQAGGMLAAGALDANGNYELLTNQVDGLTPGKYRVKILAWERTPDPPDGGLPPPGKLLIPEKFTRADTSGLVFEVAPGRNRIDIELHSE